MPPLPIRDAATPGVDTPRCPLPVNDIGQDLRELFDLANRNDVAIYPVDPRGLAVSELNFAESNRPVSDRAYLQSTIESLRAVADATDGRAVVNRNDITMAMKQIVKDQSAYYLLGYSSTLSAQDGKFHELSVKVKRPGLQVRYRRGYRALPPESATAAPQSRVMPSRYTAALASTRAPRSRLLHSWIGASRGKAGTTQLTFSWEVTAGALANADVASRPARVAVMVIGVDGMPLYRGRALSRSLTTLAGSVTFELPPGRVQLRLSAESIDNETLGTETRELDVPDFATTALGNPRLFRSRAQAEWLRLKADENAAPTATREFSRAERVFVRIPIYVASEARTNIRGRLLGPLGNVLAELAATPSAADDSALEVDLPVATLPAGDYLLELAGGGVALEAAPVVGFHVTS